MQTTEDEQSRDEKIKRASLEIKTAHATASPPSSRKMPCLAVKAAAAANGNGCSPGLHQPAISTASTVLDATEQQAEQGGQQQQQQQQPARQEPGVSPVQQYDGDVEQLVLTPQEVLQELLGDMYIDQSRLTMGE